MGQYDRDAVSPKYLARLQCARTPEERKLSQITAQREECPNRPSKARDHFLRMDGVTPQVTVRLGKLV